jgi:hypothetical protein
MSNISSAFKGVEKLIDLIKSSGWQTAAGTAAFGLLWWLVQVEALPPLEPTWLLHAVALSFLLCLFLTIATLIEFLSKPIQRWFNHVRAKHILATVAEKAIPFLTERERKIVGYLLHHNMKVFDADDDGGYAASLLGRGFVVILAKRGQVIDLTRVPMMVPDPVWNAWMRHKEEFHYKPEMRDGCEVHPWRISWMAR